jgi:cation diffusion facilitator family transporter
MINPLAERRIRWVLALTGAVMVAEIVAGLALGSMAVLAEGWHMSTHVAALGIAAIACAYARHNRNAAAAKVLALGGFSSGVVLGLIALLVIGESFSRLWSPEEILFNEAIAIAALGLLVNLFCAFVLSVHHHMHDGVVHAHAPHEADHNLRGAYLHVLSDAMLSAFAIAALAAGKLLGLTWMDPITGIAGAVVIAQWSRKLVRETAPILLDSSPLIVGDDRSIRG